MASPTPAPPPHAAAAHSAPPAQHRARGPRHHGPESRPQHRREGLPDLRLQPLAGQGGLHALPRADRGRPPVLGCRDPRGFVLSLARPCTVVLLVQAGPAIDATIEALSPTSTRATHSEPLALRLASLLAASATPATPDLIRSILLLAGSQLEANKKAMNIQRLSPDMSLQLASDTILRMLRACVHHHRQGQIVHNLSHATNLDARLTRLEEKSRHVQLTDESIYDSCRAVCDVPR